MTQYDYIQINEASRMPKYRQIMRSIVKGIKSGKLQLGDKIPSINGLSEEYDLSRDTVEKAYSQLKEQNIIVSARGKGYYIAKTDLSIERSVLFLINKLSSYKMRIFNAFVEHLINQAKPGDVVIFHFSGYGSRIKSKNILGGMENALIPIDGSEAIDNSETIANYLLEDTLLLMLQSLATERATAILDTSYYRPSISQPAGLRYRCWKAPLEGLFLAEEIEFQKQLTKKTAPDKLSVLLASSSSSKDVAKEIVFSDFSAGLFTYALTQYL